MDRTYQIEIIQKCIVMSHSSLVAAAFSRIHVELCRRSEKLNLEMNGYNRKVNEVKNLPELLTKPEYVEAGLRAQKMTERSIRYL